MDVEDIRSLGTINDHEFTEVDHDATEPPIREGVVPEEEEKKKRGPKRIEEKWTRVLAIQ